MDAAKLAVVGAGPKAAALAARVAAIHEWRTANPEDAAGTRPPPTLHIFERSSRVGAHWYGDDGYTDGMQDVCTPPHHDLVFPPRSLLGDALDLNPFSWHSFEQHRGSVHPSQTHRHVADYVEWVLRRAIAMSRGEIVLHTNTNVTSLEVERGRWVVVASNAIATRFDGVVITSPGPAQLRFHATQGAQARISDARQYWSDHRKDVHASIGKGGRVVVVGAGGAAAAICVDALSTLNEDVAEPGGIVLVAPQATMFTRGESRFETQVLTQAETWLSLPREARRQVTEHLLSGVVFRRVLERLDGLEYLPSFFVGRAIAATEHGSRVGLWCLSLEDRATLIEADWIIDATGFDALWFAALLPEPTRSIVRRLGVAVLSEHVDNHMRLIVEASMFDDDAVRESLVAARPALHVPFLAGGARPPGRATLLQLGLFADEILQPYL